MSYGHEPQDPQIRIENHLPMDPEVVHEFLSKYGWVKHHNNHPITGNTLYTRHINGQKYYCEWAEAVAYEFIRFITLGGSE
jgi:hypothetical protein